MIVCGIVLFNKDTGVGNTMDQNIPDCKSNKVFKMILISTFM